MRQKIKCWTCEDQGFIIDTAPDDGSFMALVPCKNCTKGLKHEYIPIQVNGGVRINNG